MQTLSVNFPLLGAALAVGLLALPASAAREKKPAEWPPGQMPLQLSVRTPQDLQFKNVVERQYLIFNLLAAGKVAWDQGDFAAAAGKWESLLQLPGLDPDIDKVVRPLALEARKQAGAAASATPLPPPPAPRESPERREERREERKPALVAVEGVVSGGGAAGPGGAVVTLKRTDGAMARIVPVKGKLVLQKNKAFVPRVVAVPVGSTLLFRNEDPLFHNVFSLSPAAAFDTGLYKAGNEKEEQFDKPGVVELLCNIHAQMQGHVVVVDTPYYAQADGAGAFKITGVPPGEYDLEAWHELAAKPSRQKLTVGKDGAKVSITVGGDKQANAFPPDKYGKPRQQQLGY